MVFCLSFAGRVPEAVRRCPELDVADFSALDNTRFLFRAAPSLVKLSSSSELSGTTSPALSNLMRQEAAPAGVFQLAVVFRDAGSASANLTDSGMFDEGFLGRLWGQVLGRTTHKPCIAFSVGGTDHGQRRVQACG